MRIITTLNLLMETAANQSCNGNVVIQAKKKKKKKNYPLISVTVQRNKCG